MKHKKYNLKNAILIFVAVFLAIFLVSSLFLTVDFSATATDLRYYRIAGILLFATLELGVLLEMNILNLRSKFPLIKSSKASKHILFWCITVLLAILLFFIPYNMTSVGFRDQLNKNDTHVQNNHVSNPKVTTTTKTSEASTDNATSNTFTTTHGSTLTQPKAPTTTITTPSSTSQNNETTTVTTSSEALPLTWETLSKQPDRYTFVLTLLGENFHTRQYADSAFSDLTVSEKQLVQELYDYANTHEALPSALTETFTAFCVGEEYENMILEAYNNPFYNALSKSFVVGWKADNTYHISIKEDLPSTTHLTQPEYVVGEMPLILTFDDTEHSVGNCSVKLTKIELVNSSFNSRFIRIHATIVNRSSEETYISCGKDEQFFIGQYYANDEIERIGWNDNYHWRVDPDIETDLGWTLNPNETREVCVSGVFHTEKKLKYTDKPRLDLYFVSNEETLTININRKTDE